MKNVKRTVVAIITLCSLFAFNFSASAATKEYGPWKITSQFPGDYETVIASPNYVTSLKVKIKQYGIHSGEQADMLWVMWETGTVGGPTWSKEVKGDWEGTLTFTGMDPQKDYTVGWRSLTGNDMGGQWSVIISFFELF